MIYDTDAYGYKLVYSEIYDEGAWAKEENHPRETCPYAHGSPEGWHWLKGWEDTKVAELLEFDMDAELAKLA